jgi:hypothetical protein
VVRPFGVGRQRLCLRAVQAATGRSRFISFIGSYHGSLSGSMSVSGHTAMTHSLPRAGLVLLPYPDSYRPNFTAGEVLKLLDYQFATTCPPAQVAAIFIEPLMSDGGLIVPPPGFLAAIQERCRRHGILVIVDEVKVGLARSGKLHCFEHEGLQPDLVVFGKGLGGACRCLRSSDRAPSWTMRRPSRFRPPGATRSPQPPAAPCCGRLPARVSLSARITSERCWRSECARSRPSTR